MEEFSNNLENSGTDFDIEKSNELDDFGNNLESNEGVETNETSEENDVFVDEFPDKSSEDKSLKNDDNVFVDEFPDKNIQDNVTEYSKEQEIQADSSVDIKQINTLNSHLEGQKHPVTGVPFERDQTELPDGKKIEGVYPKFNSLVDVKLPKEKLQSSDYRQFEYCNQKLKNELDVNSSLKKEFTEYQLNEIKAGYTPEGCTWHHHQETGKMQLVKSDAHNKTAHTGGKSIWGGGKENR